MSYIDDYPRMKEFENLYGNAFAAIIQVSDQARKEVDKSYHILSSSQALSYVLNQKIPHKMSKVTYNKRFTYADYMISQLEDDLKDIYDENLREAVKKSLYNSFKAGYLIYSYKNIDIPQKQGRVRILCKILWDKVIR